MFNLARLFLNSNNSLAFNKLFFCVKKWQSTLIVFTMVCLFSIDSHAQLNQFEVGTDTIHSTLTNPTYDDFDFTSPFASAPAVFALTSTRGANSCIIRFQNIDTEGFEAACVEDDFYDGEHLDVPLQYIALREGVQVIPSNAGSSNDVTFEVGCLDTTAVQHNCTSGCPAESSVPITFSSALTNPVVLTSIQTTNNQTLGAPPTNPVKPMLSPVVDNLTGSGFDLSLDLNKEDMIASIAAEKVCWLAVEQVSRCDLAGTDATLDFSGIGGPASVAFESIITPTNIDGWDQACNNGEEATFTPSCFTNTPVAVASLRSRNAAEGEDEGWLRYCTLNSGELRLTIDEQTTTRSHVDEQASVLAFGSSFSTPVTLARFNSERVGRRKVNFEWETESESFNVGFNLWAEVAGEWQQINKKLISSNAVGLTSAENYEMTIRLDKDTAKDLQSVGISSIDNSGYEEFFGPFELGDSYGEKAQLSPIDWSEVRTEYELSMLEKGYINVAGRWKKSTRQRQKRAQRKEHQINRQLIEFDLEQDGIHKVTFEEFVAASAAVGNNSRFDGIRLKRLAITHNGKAIPRIINSLDDTFGPGDEIIFHAHTLAKQVALYDDTLVYRLEVNASKAITARPIATLPAEQATSNSSEYLKSFILNQQAEYSPTITNGDPWFIDSIRSIGSPGVHQYEFELPAINQSSMNSQVLVNISGGLNFPGVASEEPDHHVEVRLNDQLIGSARFDGFNNQLIELDVSSEILQQGSNIVSLTLPGDTGQFADIVKVESVRLNIPQKSVVNETAINISAQQSVNNYVVENESGLTDLSVFAVQANGNFAPLFQSQIHSDTLNFQAIVDQDLLSELSYWVVPESAYLKAKNLREVEPQNLVKEFQQQKADYLIVAHPSFIDETLETFIDAKQNNGHTVSVVSWLDVVDSYGYGLNTPHSLQNMLRELGTKSSIKYLLLVGGHSYDYNDHLNNGNVNFIPTFYETVSKSFEYAPTDNGFADLNASGLPNIAIGRWPVRSKQDLELIVNKTLKWEQNSVGYNNKSLLISDVTDSERGQQFSTQLEELAPLLTDDIQGQELTRVYLDSYLEQDFDDPVQQAKKDLLTEFSEQADGVGLTIFNGHSSTSRWTFRNLFNANDALSMNNVERPTLVMPLACYTSYYETTSNNSLAHQLLFANEGGAVAVSGAAYLSDYRENALFAKKVLRIKKNQDVSWGQAILKAKRTMVEWNDAVTNWAFLGDPSIK